jgi:DNA-binding HxlR family transcriptional regulator
MLDLFRSKKSTLSSSQKEMLTQTHELLTEMLQKIDLRFNELSAQVREVELSVKELEMKLLTKDLKDKQQMGAIHYKLHERSNPRLEAEIEGIEVELSTKKRALRDQ